MADRTRSEYWAQRFLSSLKRIALRIGVIAGLVAFEFLVLFCTALVGALIEKLPERIQEFGAIVLLLAYVSAHLLFWFFVVYPPRRFRNRWLKKDADLWLKERHATGYRPSPIIQKLVRRLIWTPSILALVVLLFFPELWGVWSQRHLPRPFTISGHQLQVPRTWILLWRGPLTDGHEYADFIIVKGAWAGRFKDWSIFIPPIANFTVKANAGSFYSNPERVRFVRTIRNGDLELRCWGRPLDYQAAWIDCSSPNGEMKAGFYGSGIYLDDFYAAIEK